MEQLTFTLSQSETVKSFVSEKNIQEYFHKADKINEMLTGSISNLGLIGSVIYL